MTQPHPHRPDTALIPVPVALFLPPAHPAIPNPDDLSAHVAGLLVVTYTRPGDRITDCTGSVVLARMATALHRHIATNASRSSVRLIYARLPHPDHLDTDLVSVAEWMREQRLALAPGGFLITAVSADRADDGYIDRATSVITAARSAGLVYHQHLVTVHTPIPETSPPDESATAFTGPPRPGGRLYTRTHGDLFVFTANTGGHHA